jgi:hypothetical protein
MSGGFLAVQKKFFHDIGEYDLGMEIWGGENIEFAIRVFLETLCHPLKKILFNFFEKNGKIEFLVKN